MSLLLVVTTPGAVGTEPDPLTEIRGSVEAIDRQVEWVRVAGGAASPGMTTLQFVKTTEIMVQGRAGSIQDLREGDLVKASYEDRHGIRLLHRIEVLPAN